MTEIATIGVLGAGTMGAGITQVAAEAGFQVLVHEAQEGAFDRARERIDGFLQRKAEKDELTLDEVTAALRRITAVDAIEKLGAADLVIEAIPEDLDLKRDAFRRLDAAAGAETILATNTSSLSVARIAAATERPERVVGMHFFNPVPLMALVEVIAGPMTGPTCLEATVRAATRLGKTPVIAADTPGFIVNRVARPYYLEALRIVGDGAAGVEAVDGAMKRIGFRMGPFELIDAIGADVNLAVSQAVFEQFFFDPRYRPHPLQRTLVEAGRLGRKSGGGFYDYAEDGSRRGVWVGVARHVSGPTLDTLEEGGIVARTLATIVNEAASAVAEGVATPEAIDTAMRLGAHHPMGPLQLADFIGLDTCLSIMQVLYEGLADSKYRPCPLLVKYVEAGWLGRKTKRGFYDYRGEKPMPTR